MTEGPLAGRRIAVEAQLLIGREAADVTIEDPLVSRRHALVRPAGRGVEIEDLGSLNGTWVNGERVVGTTQLAAGDVVHIGGAVLTVEEEPAPTRGTVLGPSPHEAAEARRASTPPPPEPPKPEEADRRGEPMVDEVRPVTALFADIVGSTALGERLAPHEVKVVIGECVNRMSHAVEQFGGVVQAYMGDGIAVFFGVPQAHEDDAERAARAALRILNNVREYALEIEKAWGISDFGARIGINTGEAAVGAVGAAEPGWVSLGDTTNVAARLQSAAEPNTIVVGPTTARALIHKFVLEPLGPITVKGRQEPVEAWRLIEAQAAVRAAPTTPLAGREEEMARLRTSLDELTAGRGQIVFLLGEAGIGKTRLVDELGALAVDRGTLLEGHCLSYGTDLLYGPFIEILRSWLGAEEGEADLSVRTKLHAKLGLLPESQRSDVLPFLARLLSLRPEPSEEERLRALTPHELAAEIRRAYRTWVAALARRGPVVLAVEDVHWADRSSRELVEDLLELVDVTPLLLLATSRIDPGSEGWSFRVRVLAEYPHRAVDLRLQPLSEEASRLLLRGLPGRSALRESDLDLILASAEGNPLYLEELLNAFTESPLGGGQTWAPTASESKVLTPTLESLLLARIDLLPASSRRLAQVAAVIGRSFPLRVLAQVAEGDELERDLATLLRADVIRELRGYPEAEYTFRHGLLRQACLSTLPPDARRRLYGSIGAAFETLFADALEDHLEVIAHYYARSDELGKALAYLERAAERAAALDAADRAAELSARAAKVAEKLGGEAAR
jgi:class 3 adenylate cyclase